MLVSKARFIYYLQKYKDAYEEQRRFMMLLDLSLISLFVHIKMICLTLTNLC